MNIKSNEKANLWSCKKNEKRKGTYDAIFTTYEGTDENDSAKYSRWNAYFVGKAATKVKDLNNFPVKILLKQAKIDNVYNENSNRKFYHIIVFDFDVAENENE